MEEALDLSLDRIRNDDDDTRRVPVLCCVFSVDKWKSTCNILIVMCIMRWAWHVARMGEGRGVLRVLVGKPEGKRPFGIPRRRWEDNIKMDL